MENMSSCLLEDACFIRESISAKRPDSRNLFSSGNGCHVRSSFFLCNYSLYFIKGAKTTMRAETVIVKLSFLRVYVLGLRTFRKTKALDSPGHGYPFKNNWISRFCYFPFIHDAFESSIEHFLGKYFPGYSNYFDEMWMGLVVIMLHLDFMKSLK